MFLCGIQPFLSTCDFLVICILYSRCPPPQKRIDQAFTALQQPRAECSSRGFEVIAGATPVLQVIFQYSVLLPTFRSWGPEGDALLDDAQPR